MITFNDWLNTRISESNTSYEQDLDPNKKIIVNGVYGLKSKPFKKMFKNMDAYDKWTESDDFDNFEVYTVGNA